MAEARSQDACERLHFGLLARAALLVRPAWGRAADGDDLEDLVAAHADVVLSGHNHDYERFDPIGRTSQDAAASSGTNDGNAQFPGPPSRSTWYPATASLSLEAVQLRSISLAPIAVAVTPAGTLGACVSGGPKLIPMLEGGSGPLKIAEVQEGCAGVVEPRRPGRRLERGE